MPTIKLRIEIERYWINQPSSSQPYYEYHGMNVLGMKIDDKTTMIYFLGDVVSFEVPTIVLSKGWH